MVPRYLDPDAKKKLWFDFDLFLFLGKYLEKFEIS